MSPEKSSVVALTAAGADAPMAGGLAKYVEKPEPLTVEDAESVVAATGPEMLNAVVAVSALPDNAPVNVVAVTVVKLPAAGADAPIAGGLAKYVEKPEPLTVDEAESVVASTGPDTEDASVAVAAFPDTAPMNVVAVAVVKFPVEGADAPIAGGLARYAANPAPLTVDEADKVVAATGPETPDEVHVNTFAIDVQSPEISALSWFPSPSQYGTELTAPGV